MNLIELFDKTYVINLSERRDRRRATTTELRRYFPSPTVAERVTFHSAVRPDGAGPFPTQGSHGAFLSTIEVLTAAVDEGLERVLLMQDDVRFTAAFHEHGDWLLSRVAGDDWDIMQLGYIDLDGATDRHAPAAPVMVDFEQEVIGAHCIGFRGPAIGAMLDHLHICKNGEPGDDWTGPMSVDGAFNTFAWCRPEFRRMLPVPNMVGQRNSRSDVRPSRVDRIAPLRPLAAFARSAYLQLSTRRAAVQRRRSAPDLV
jgi:glycosyl transferase, family 25